MVHRLYLTDSYLREFDATVAESLTHDGKPAVVLDSTAFYASSGGQPNDTGTLSWGRLQSAPVGQASPPASVGQASLPAPVARASPPAPPGEAKVLDVIERGDVNIHLIDQPIAVGTKVHGVIDAARRRDHMQQHDGQHILTQAFIKVAGAETVSFHLGPETCTIDLTSNGVSAETMRAAEDLANSIVQENRAIVVHTVSREEAGKFPIRKLPDVTGAIRIVDIGGFDCCPCSGTHPKSTGEVGPIRVRSTERVKNVVRVEFLCGGRALRAHRAAEEILERTAQSLTCRWDEVPNALVKAKDEAAGLRKAVRELGERLVGFEWKDVLAAAPSVEATGGPVRVVSLTFNGAEGDRAKWLVERLIAPEAGPRVIVAAVVVAADRVQLTAARSPDLSLDVRPALQTACAALGGKGGGRPHFAQGGGTQVSAAAGALEALRAGLVAGLRPPSP